MERENIVNLKEINPVFLAVSIGVIIFLFGICSLSYLGFLFHFSINQLYIWLSLSAMIFFLYKFNKFHFLSFKEVVVEILILLLVFSISAILSYYFLDNSWDGRAYHQEAIILLANGWNPICPPPDAFNPSIWVEHYPKCAEILSANFALFFNNIEAGKTVNYLFAYSTFFLCFFTFNKFKFSKIRNNILLSALIIFNPISLGQIKTFYVDILIYYLFVDILFFIILKEKDFIGNKSFVFLLPQLISMLCSIKLGGIFYSIIILLNYILYLLIQKNFKTFKHVISIILTSIALILVFGINPYFTNIKQGLNPFYPLAGRDKIDIMTFNSPKSFQNKNSLYKLFISTFSNTKNISYTSDRNPKLKTPFSIINQAGKYGTDMRIGGFGYFWSGILLLLLPFVILNKNEISENNKIYYFTIILLWSSVLLNPESWWARYVPQFWLIPIFIIFWKSLNINQNNFNKNFSLLLIILLFCNSLILEFQNLKEAFKFNSARNKFFSSLKNKEIDIYISADSDEASTLYYKMLKNNTKVNRISENYYLTNKKDFSEIPFIINSIGAYKIDE